MDKVIKDFFETYFSLGNLYRVYVEGKTPKEMMVSEVDESGWYAWKPLPGDLSLSDYTIVEDRFGVKFPKSFVKWHKTYYFLDGDCSLLRLPYSNPKQPLLDVIERLDYDLGKDLAKLKLYAFAEDGSDAGPLVFDGRVEMPDNEFPIRMYDHEYVGDLDGLSEIIFSSFDKLLECVTHFLQETKKRKVHEVIPEFLAIDPTGAGVYGLDRWLTMANSLRDEDNGKDY